MEQQYYFAEDGNYGDATNIVIVDTTEWTEEDWNEVEEAPDYERVDIARSISKKYRGE